MWNAPHVSRTRYRAGPIILKSFESATLFCKSRYSTDGSVGKVTFEAACDGFGTELVVEGSGQPIQCDEAAHSDAGCFVAELGFKRSGSYPDQRMRPVYYLYKDRVVPL